jgi:hypothetical protein
MALEETLKQKQTEEQINELIEKRKASLKDTADQIQFEIELNKMKSDQEEKALRNQITLLERRKELTDEEKVQLADAQSGLAKIIVEEDRRLKNANKQLEDLEKENKKVKEIKELYFGIGENDKKRVGYAEKFKNNLNDVLKTSKTITKEEAISSLTNKLKEAAVAATTMAFKGGISFNTVTSQLNQATNTSGKYNNAVRDIMSSNMRFGITAEDAAKSIASLHNEFSDFSNLSEQAQTNLAETTAKLEKAGISADATARFMNTATKSMGMSAEQTAKFSKELVAFAHVNGISTKAINDGLSSVMPRLAAFGAKGPAIFKDMAFRSKELGIEMGKLLDITEQFTTFEGAAEAAGNLNSVLGGNYIDTLELLRASSEDPVKAQDMLRDALQKTGKSFEQLSGQQRRMFADMLGMDVNTAGAFFKKTSLEAKQAADAEKTFNDAVASFIPIGQKLTAIGAKMAPVFQLFASVMGTVVDIFSQFLDLPFMPYLVGIVGGLLAVGGAITAVGITVGGFLLTMLAQFLTVKTLITGANASIAASSAAAGTTVAAAGAEAAVGGAGFATAGAEVAAGSTAAAGGITGFVAIVTPLLPFLGSIALVILAIGAAFLMTGVGIALAIVGIGVGIGLVVLAFAHLVDLLIKGGTNSLTAAAAFIVLSASLFILAKALAAIGMIGSIGVGVLGALSLIMLVFGASFLMVGQGMAMAKEGFDAITNFEISKLESIRDVMKDMADYMERVAKASITSSVALMNPLMMPIMAAAAATVPATNLTAAIPSAVTTKATGGGEATMTANITIEMPVSLDGKVLDKKIVSKVVQLKQNGNEMSNTFGSTSTVNGFTTNS